jgi:transcriptional regulator with XRE-family HTH domain
VTAIALLQLPPASEPSAFYRELRERVRRIRSLLGISSASVAHAAGMHPSSYCHFEMGQRRISAAQFLKIQQFFGEAA